MMVPDINIDPKTGDAAMSHAILLLTTVALVPRITVLSIHLYQK